MHAGHTWAAAAWPRTSGRAEYPGWCRLCSGPLPADAQPSSPSSVRRGSCPRMRPALTVSSQALRTMAMCVSPLSEARTHIHGQSGWRRDPPAPFSRAPEHRPHRWPRGTEPDQSLVRGWDTLITNRHFIPVWSPSEPQPAPSTSRFWEPPTHTTATPRQAPLRSPRTDGEADAGRPRVGTGALIPRLPGRLPGGIRAGEPAWASVGDPGTAGEPGAHGRRRGRVCTCKGPWGRGTTWIALQRPRGPFKRAGGGRGTAERKG